MKRVSGAKTFYVEEFSNRGPGQNSIRWTVNRDKAMPFEDTEAAAAVLMIREILDEDYVLGIEPA